MLQAKKLGNKLIGDYAKEIGEAAKEWVAGKERKVWEPLGAGTGAPRLQLIITPVDFGLKTELEGRMKNRATMPAMPSQEDVDRMYNELMESLGMGADFKNPTAVQSQALANMSTANKWAMICSHRAQETEVKGKIEESTQYWASKLANKEIDAKEMRRLQTVLAGKPLSWIAEFCETALGPLLNILEKTEAELFRARGGAAGLRAPGGGVEAPASPRSSNNVDLQTHGIACLKVLLNNKTGMDGVVSNPTGVRTLVMCISRGAEVANLLTAIGFSSSEAHSKVLDGFSHLRSMHKEPARFSTLLQLLMTASSSADLIAYMSLINTLISSSSDIDLRMATRQEFQRQGMDQLVETLKKKVSGEGGEDVDLDTLLATYEEERAADESEMTDRFAQLGVDHENAEELFGALQASTSAAGVKDSFLQMLQNMLIVPVDTPSGLRTFLLMARLVRQVSLNKARVGKNDDMPLEELLESVTPDVEEVPLRKRIEMLETDLADTNKYNKVMDIESKEKDDRIKELEAKVAEAEERAKKAVEDAAAATERATKAAADAAAAAAAAPAAAAATAAPAAPAAPDAPPAPPGAPDAPPAPGAPDAPPAPPAAP